MINLLEQSGFIQNIALQGVNKQLQYADTQRTKAKKEGNKEMFSRWNALCDEYLNKQQLILEDVE